MGGAEVPYRTANEVEPGYKTTEFWVTSCSAAVIAVLGVVTAFGAPLTPEQKTAILVAIPPVLGLIASVYTFARSWRKK